MARKKIVKKIKAGKTAIIFRYLGAKDLDSCLEHINSLVDERAMITIQKKETRKEEAKWIKETLREIKRKNRIVLIADVGGKVMGVANVTKGRGGREHSGLFGISLRKPIRGMGVGGKLLKAVIEEAKKVLGIKMVVLEVFASNKIAQRLYRKCGFRTTGRIRSGVKFYGKYDDIITMVKYL